MSEYQYYEFQAIDRPLTDEEQQAASRLSSRVEPHPRRAVFVYNYSDFPGRARDVLAKYYDALFYIANWGSVQLAFRFPKALVDVQGIEAYCIEDAAKASQEPLQIVETDVRRAIARLSREECEAWLLRLAQDEVHLGLAFQRHLQGSDGSATAERGQRTVAELLSLAEGEETRASQRAQAEAEARRIRKLEAVAPKAEETWTFAEQLIAQSNARAYDEAVQLLVKLRDWPSTRAQRRLTKSGCAGFEKSTSAGGR